MSKTLTRDHIAIAHRDPARRALVARLKQFQTTQLDPKSTLGRVASSGRSEHFFEVDDEYLEGVAQDSDDLAIMRELEIRSGIVVPLQVRSRTVGVMTFCTAESQRRLTSDDVDLAEQLADEPRWPSRPLGCARLCRASGTLQQSLIPSDPPEPGLGARILRAGGARSESRWV